MAAHTAARIVTCLNEASPKISRKNPARMAYVTMIVGQQDVRTVSPQYAFAGTKAELQYTPDRSCEGDCLDDGRDKAQDGLIPIATRDSPQQIEKRKAEQP
jgi:hypothetical protein